MLDVRWVFAGIPFTLCWTHFGFGFSLGVRWVFSIRWVFVGIPLDFHWILLGCSLDAPWMFIRLLFFRDSPLGFSFSCLIGFSLDYARFALMLP